VTGEATAGVAAALAVLAAVCASMAARARSTWRLVRRVVPASDDAARTRSIRHGWSRVLNARAGRIALGGGGLFLGLSVGGPPLALAGVVAGAAVPGAVRRRSEVRRRDLVEAQLAEAIAGIAAALRSGLSLSQAIRFVASEGDPPVSTALGRVVEMEGLGVPLDEALARWARGDPSPDVRLSAAVLQLHHRVGGDSPAVLDQVARTLRQRRAAGRELRSLTAQARLSGAVLGLLPIGFFAFMSIVSRSDVAAAYHSPAGLASILIGLALDAGAFLWIRHLLAVRT
jgi:tight adherence protein B